MANREGRERRCSQSCQMFFRIDSIRTDDVLDPSQGIVLSLYVGPQLHTCCSGEQDPEDEKFRGTVLETPVRSRAASIDTTSTRSRTNSIDSSASSQMGSELGSPSAMSHSSMSSVSTASSTTASITCSASNMVRRSTPADVIAHKVAITNVVQDNDYFFPFQPGANPEDQYKLREPFVQATLRDLDRLYIRIVEARNDYDTFRKIARRIRALGPRFALWQFEAVIWKEVRDLRIELGDFEVFRGLRAWQDVVTSEKVESDERGESRRVEGRVDDEDATP